MVAAVFEWNERVRSSCDIRHLKEALVKAGNQFQNNQFEALGI